MRQASGGFLATIGPPAPRVRTNETVTPARGFGDAMNPVLDRLRRLHVAAQATLRVAAYNIKHCQGMDGVVDLDRVAAVLRALDADAVTLQEIDRGVERTGGVDQAARLGELLGMESVFGDFMPYQGGEYGMAVLSRLPILGSKNHRLPERAEPRAGGGVDDGPRPNAAPCSPRGRLQLHAGGSGHVPASGVVQHRHQARVTSDVSVRRAQP